MAGTKTVQVPHLGGITAGYQMPHPYDPAKPTLVLVNSFTTSSELYRGQYQGRKLTSSMNLLAVELLGHGQTRTKTQNWTYWDTAIMNLQVMEALGVEKAFVLGTSQGGWITVRMALLAPDKVWFHHATYLIQLKLTDKHLSGRSKALYPLALPLTTSPKGVASLVVGMAPRISLVSLNNGPRPRQHQISSPMTRSVII